MVTPIRGTVILIPFPFSDLSASKLRPALVLADADNGDWILCQITSKPYADNKAIEIKSSDFSSGTLKVVSYAQPAKLFTANVSFMIGQAGVLKKQKLGEIVDAVVRLFQ